MADIIVPESYLLMTHIIIKLRFLLHTTSKLRLVRRLILGSRLEDFEFTRDVTVKLQLARGDMLYKTLPADYVIARYLYNNGLITIGEWTLCLEENCGEA